MDDDEVAPFVDSNIWLYALVAGDDPTKTQLAREVVQRGCRLSTQVVNEICVNLLRKAGRSENEIAELVRCLHRQHAVSVVDEEVMLRAVDLRRAYSLSYWDSLIVSAALLSGATRLLTEDLQDGLLIEGQLQVINPLLAR
jgi:predicted nucleic acid-binding protein